MQYIHFGDFIEKREEEEDVLINPQKTICKNYIFDDLSVSGKMVSFAGSWQENIPGPAERFNVEVVSHVSN